MYIKQILRQETRIGATAFLYEGLDNKSSKTMYLWENAGFKLKEAALSQDQITQLFQQIEQNAAATGSNRTAIGKGKDAAGAVARAWNDLKTQVQNSKPIKNVDKKYDSVIAKIESGLGGPDNALTKVIQKYRTFAKKHPIAQGFVYATLIAAAGISGAGLGAAATLGLLKTADKLLQGETFSSAVYQGSKTGALAYGAGKISDYASSNGQSNIQSNIQSSVPDASSPTPALTPTYPEELASLSHAADIKAANEYLAADDKERQEIRYITGLTDQQLKNIAKQHPLSDSIIPSWQVRSKKLTEAQIGQLFYVLTSTPLLINEGPMDAVKSAIGKGASKLKTVGRNLTNKITTDKLMSAWKAAGKPTQDTAIVNMLRGAGISSEAIASAFEAIKLAPPGSTTATIAPQSNSNVIGPTTSTPKTTPAGRVYKAKQQSTVAPTPAAGLPTASVVPPAPAVELPAIATVAPIGSTISLTSSRGTVIPFTKTEAGWVAYTRTAKQKVYDTSHPNFAKIEKHWSSIRKPAIVSIPVTGTIFDTPDKLLSDFNSFVSTGNVSAGFKTALKNAMAATGLVVTESLIRKNKRAIKKLHIKKKNETI